MKKVILILCFLVWAFAQSHCGQDGLEEENAAKAERLGGGLEKKDEAKRAVQGSFRLENDTDVLNSNLSHNVRTSVKYSVDCVNNLIAANISRRAELRNVKDTSEYEENCFCVSNGYCIGEEDFSKNLFKGGYPEYIVRNEILFFNLIREYKRLNGMDYACSDGCKDVYKYACDLKKRRRVESERMRHKKEEEPNEDNIKSGINSKRSSDKLCRWADRLIRDGLCTKQELPDGFDGEGSCELNDEKRLSPKAEELVDIIKRKMEENRKKRQGWEQVSTNDN